LAGQSLCGGLEDFAVSTTPGILDRQVVVCFEVVWDMRSAADVLLVLLCVL